MNKKIITFETYYLFNLRLHSPVENLYCSLCTWLSVNYYADQLKTEKTMTLARLVELYCLVSRLSLPLEAQYINGYLDINKLSTTTQLLKSRAV